jgi:hypothetical protein
MALQRSDTTVVTGEVVEADYDDIVAFQVDLPNKSIAITVASGNIVDDKIDIKSTKNFIIQDKPETNAYVEETIAIVDNSITLEGSTSDGRVVFFIQTPIVDYSVDNNVVTFNNEEEITGLTEIKVGYGKAIAADPVFSLMASQMADGDKSIYLNLKQLMWDKLIELGHVSGTIV